MANPHHYIYSRFEIFGNRLGVLGGIVFGAYILYQVLILPTNIPGIISGLVISIFAFCFSITRIIRNLHLGLAYEISDESIKMKSDNGTINLPWRSIQDAWITWWPTYTNQTLTLVSTNMKNYTIDLEVTDFNLFIKQLLHFIPPNALFNPQDTIYKSRLSSWVFLFFSIFLTSIIVICVRYKYVPISIIGPIIFLILVLLFLVAYKWRTISIDENRFSYKIAFFGNSIPLDKISKVSVGKNPIQMVNRDLVVNVLYNETDSVILVTNEPFAVHAALIYAMNIRNKKKLIEYT